MEKDLPAVDQRKVCIFHFCPLNNSPSLRSSLHLPPPHKKKKKREREREITVLKEIQGLSNGLRIDKALVPYGSPSLQQEKEKVDWLRLADSNFNLTLFSSV